MILSSGPNLSRFCQVCWTLIRNAEEASSEEDGRVSAAPQLTDGSVVSHETAVCDDRVRVEMQQHWTEGEDRSWDGAPTQGSKRSAPRGQVVDLQPVIDTTGMC